MGFTTDDDARWADDDVTRIMMFIGQGSSKRNRSKRGVVLFQGDVHVSLYTREFDPSAQQTRQTRSTYCSLRLMKAPSRLVMRLSDPTWFCDGDRSLDGNVFMDVTSMSAKGQAIVREVRINTVKYMEHMDEDNRRAPGPNAHFHTSYGIYKGAVHRLGTVVIPLDALPESMPLYY